MISFFAASLNVELQQRSIEYSTLFKTPDAIRWLVASTLHNITSYTGFKFPCMMLIDSII